MAETNDKLLKTSDNSQPIQSEIKKQKENSGPEKKKNEKIKIGPLLILICLTIILLGLVYFVPVVSANIIASKATNLYKTSKNDISKNIEDQINKIIDDYVEGHYSFNSNVKIEIGNINELSNLEVLNISYTSYVKEDGKDNSLNMTVWEAITGRGTYIIDLSLAEINADIARKTVMVSAPKPVLVRHGIDENDVEILLEKNDIDANFFDNDSKVEAEIHQRLEEKAKEEIYTEFMSNSEYYENAKKSAKSCIEKMIIGLNPDIDDLTVEVSFN